MRRALFAATLALAGACRPAIRGPTASPLSASDAGTTLIEADAGMAGGGDPDGGPASLGAAHPFKAYDINHVLSTGQSLAVGVASGPPLTLSQPFGNLMFNTGVMAGTEDISVFTGFQPLTEGDNIPGSKAIVETMGSSFANLVAGLAREAGTTHDILLSNHASGAKTYAQLKKGTKYFNNGMNQVTAALAISKQLGKSYVVRAVTTVHGESDHAEKSTRYEADLLEWQADYEKEVQAITGQTEPIPMFETQISSWQKMMAGTETSEIPAAQLAAHVHGKGKVVLVGPKYHLAYAKDGVHLTAEGYRHMGEDYAKAYRKVVLEQQPWEPLRPIEVTRSGAVITVRLLVPAPPLVLDTTLVSDPGNFGFEYVDAAASSPRIVKVELVSPDTVAITLSAEPAADDRHLRYAFTGVRKERSGPTSGPRGNLRDSDATKSRTGKQLYNWCIHFDERVP